MKKSYRVNSKNVDFVFGEDNSYRLAIKCFVSVALDRASRATNNNVFDLYLFKPDLNSYSYRF